MNATFGPYSRRTSLTSFCSLPTARNRPICPVAYDRTVAHANDSRYLGRHGSEAAEVGEDVAAELDGDGDHDRPRGSRYRQVEHEEVFYEQPTITLERMRQLEDVAGNEL